MALLGMGNPLLDISNNVDDAFLAKYELKNGNAVLAEPKHLPLYAELEALPGVEYIAGGATQNSIRVAQWMSQTADFGAYIGCVGKDEYAKKLKDVCTASGVKTSYMECDEPTGTCGVLVNGKERSLVANLSAANHYDVSHLDNADVWSVVENAKVVYSAGFFMTVSPKSIEKVSRHCLEKGKTYCFNLSAPFLMEVPPFRAVLDDTMPYIDYLFGNETECATYGATSKWEEKDLKEIAKKLSLLPKEGDKKRTVVITQGADPTLVAINGEVTEYPVPAVAPDAIVDTNGAGDAFVGGFLFELVKGGDMAACIKAGGYAASVIIQRSGCTYPDKPEY